MTAGSSKDANETCENNIFHDNLAPLNAVNYFLTRFISNYSANVALLIIFWKPWVEKSTFGENKNRSEAEKLLINFIN